MEPFAKEWDEKEIFPIETLREAAKLGFGGLINNREIINYYFRYLCKR